MVGGMREGWLCWTASLQDVSAQTFFLLFMYYTVSYLYMLISNPHPYVLYLYNTPNTYLLGYEVTVSTESMHL